MGILQRLFGKAPAKPASAADDLLDGIDDGQEAVAVTARSQAAEAKEGNKDGEHMAQTVHSPSLPWWVPRT